jgi:hypothetical protein
VRHSGCSGIGLLALRYHGVSERTAQQEFPSRPKRLVVASTEHYGFRNTPKHRDLYEYYEHRELYEHYEHYEHRELYERPPAQAPRTYKRNRIEPIGISYAY